MYIRSLDTKEKMLGPDHPEVATTLNNLAGLYKAMGSFEKAANLYEKSLIVMARVFGPKHPNTAIVRANRDSCVHKH